MPAAPLPPMTTRQAKKIGKKATGQFHYTASQMRRADRREELDKRKRQEEEKEDRRKLSKRKREEQEEKERAIKRKLVKEGKISIEDTWGKVTSSQPRLNTFFKAPAVPAKRHKSAPACTPVQDAENKENVNQHDSQEDTLVNCCERRGSTTSSGESNDITDIDLLKLLSSQPHLKQDSSPRSDQKKTSQTRSRTTISTVRIMSSSILKRKRSPSPEPVADLKDDFPAAAPDAELTVAEDDTAETLPQPAADLEAFAESSSSPSKSFRSVLSEMTVANVNTRAQEKPDTTTAKEDSGLPTPSRPKAQHEPLTAQDLAEINSGDFEDHDDELLWDKENSDPLMSPDKPKSKSESKAICGGGYSTETKGESSTSVKPSSPPGFGSDNNFIDIYDYDFDTDEDFSEGIDDAILMSIAATQKLKSDIIIDAHGSPHKLTPNKNAVFKALPLQFMPGKMMPPPPPGSRFGKSSEEKKLDSMSFTSIGDDDMLEIAEQVEEELSQLSEKAAGKRKAGPVWGELQVELAQGVKGKGKEVLAPNKGRTLPWETSPLPPASTQDYLMMIADEDDDIMDV